MLAFPSYGVCSDPYRGGIPRLGKTWIWFIHAWYMNSNQYSYTCIAHIRYILHTTVYCMILLYYILH